MPAGGFRLGVDLGTTTTVAVLAHPGALARPLVFDGSELLPSAVCVGLDGRLAAGRDAIHLARANPAGFEPNPKRLVDDGGALLSGRFWTVAEMIATVLGRVAEQAGDAVRNSPLEVTLTHPASWGSARRAVLVSAARTVGWDPVRLVAEPVAAAGYLVEVVGGDVPVGAGVLVYDFGAGTFDAAVVRRTGDGFEVLADRGLPHTGGLDIDAAIVAHLGSVYSGRDPQRWQRIVRPSGVEDVRAARAFWDDVRTGKEMLSRTSSTVIPVPLFGDALLSREELDRLAAPVVARTLGAARAVIGDAERTAGPPAAVFLVGGSARLSLVATMLHRELGIAPTIVERPDLAVAEGGLYAPGGVSMVVPGASVPVPVPDPAGGSAPGAGAGTSAAQGSLPGAGAGAGASAAQGLLPGAGVEAAQGLLPGAGVEVAQGLLPGAGVEVAQGLLPGARLEVTEGPGPGGWRSKWPAGALRSRVVRRRALAVLAAAVVAGVVATAVLVAPWWPWRAPARFFGLLPGAADGVAFSPDGRYLATLGNDEVMLWSPASGKLLRTMPLPEDGEWPFALAFSGDSRLVAAGLAVWSTADGKLVASTGGDYYDTAFSPDGTLFAIASGYLPSEGVRLRQVGATGQSQQLTGDWAGSVAFSHDGALVVAGVAAGHGTTNFRCVVWDTATRAVVRTFAECHAGELLFSPGGRIFAVVNADGVALWDVETGALARSFDDPDANSVAFSPDGRTLAILTDGGTGLWDVATGVRQGTVHTDSRANEVAIHPDGRTLASAGSDVRLWDLASG